MEKDDLMPAGVTPHIVCRDAAAAIDFYKTAFGAEEMVRLPGRDGRLVHAAVLINGSMVMMTDEFPEMGGVSPLTLNGSPVTLHLNVDDAAASVTRAVAAGATLVMEPQIMFWGDLYGVVSDPFGHVWSIATPQGPTMSAAELADAMGRA